MDDHWDLAIVGAGPAGAAAALSALRERPRARVLLLDRADFPRDKTCGDGIAPHALDLLAALGAADTVPGAPPVDRLRIGLPAGPEVGEAMRRPTRVVRRLDFDARIVQAAVDAGAVLQRRHVRRLDVGPAGVVLDREIHTRAVVGADGASSVVRRALGAPPSPPGHLAVALRAYAPVRPGQRADEQVITLDPGGDWPAYAWSFPLGDGWANVGYGEVTRPGRQPTRARLLERLDALLPDAAEGAVSARGHRLPLSSRRPRQPDGRVLLAGDAMSLINPMTGEGIYYAVLSGALAGRAAARDPATAGQAYRAALRRELGGHLRATTAAAALARRPRVVHAAMRSAGRSERVFADLVELGLGRGLLTPRLLAGLGRGLLG